MWIRIHHEIIAKRQPNDAFEVEFTPLVANDYFAQILDCGFIEITKPNDQKVFYLPRNLLSLLRLKSLLSFNVNRNTQLKRKKKYESNQTKVFLARLRPVFKKSECRQISKA